MNDLYKYLIGTAAGIILCLLVVGGYHFLVGKNAQTSELAGGTVQSQYTPLSGRSADILGNTDTIGFEGENDLTAEQQERLFAAQTANESLAKQYSDGGTMPTHQNTPDFQGVNSGSLFNEEFNKQDSVQDPASNLHARATTQNTVERTVNDRVKRQVQDFIVQGKSAAQKNQLSNALSAFENADEIMPKDEDFEASSYREIADSLFLFAKAAQDEQTAQKALDEAERYVKKSLAARNNADVRGLYANIINEQKKAAEAKKQQALLAQRQEAERKQTDKKNDHKRRQVVELIGQGKNAIQKRQLGTAVSSFDQATTLMPDDNSFAADSYLEMADEMFRFSNILAQPSDIKTARDKAEAYVKMSLAARNSPAARNLYSKIIDAQKKAEDERLAQQKAVEQQQQQAAEQKKQQEQLAKRQAEDLQRQQEEARKKADAQKKQLAEEQKQQQAAELKKQQELLAQKEAENQKNAAKTVKKWEKERKQVETLLAQGKNAAQRRQLNNAITTFDRAGKLMPDDETFAADSYRTMADAMFSLSEKLTNQQDARKARRKAEDYINKSLLAQQTPASQALQAKITDAQKNAEITQAQQQIALKQQEEKQKQEAAVAAAKTQAENQKRKLEAEALVAQGKKSAATGNYTAAQSDFQKASSLLPSDDAPFAAKQYNEMAEGMLTLAQNTPAYKNQALANGTDYIKKSLAAQNNDAKSHFVYAQIADEQKNIPLAVQQLEAAQRLDPKNYLYNYELGRKYFEQKKYAKARSCFEQAVQSNPKYEAAFFNLGITHKIMNATDAALTAFSNAVALKPDYVRAWVELARLQDKKRNYAEAITNYQKALALEPSHTSAIKEMAQVYAKMKDVKQAERYFKEALTLGDTDPVTYYNLAAVQLEAGKVEDALFNAEKSLAGGNSRDSRFLYTYGLALEKNKREQEAEEYYRQAIAADGKYSKPRINLGRMYLESGKLDGAEEHLRAAAAAEPDNFEVNTNLGKLYGLKHEYGKSIDYYAKAIKIMPKDIDARQNLAAAYLSAGLKENAIETHKAIVEINSQAWDSYYELGKLYITMNNTAEAKITLETLLKLKPNYRYAAEIKKLLASL